MSADLTVDFLSQTETTSSDPTALVESVRRGGETLRELGVDQIISILDAFSARLLDRDLDIHAKYPGSGIPYIASWCRRARLEPLIDDALVSRAFLDRFIASPNRPDRAYMAFPRGLAVHWMAGNVPTLGFLSLIQGLLTKNANIIKIASQSDRLLADLLGVLADVKTPDGLLGRTIAEAVSVVRYDHERKDLGAVFSQAAETRIMWGGDDSVAQIKALPMQTDVQDIVYPAKTSLIVISRETLALNDLEPVTRKIAQDIAVFDQKACASPHTIFLETDDDADIERFAGALRQSMERAAKTLVSAVPSGQSVSAIMNLRAQYDILHKAWYSEGVQYTILSDDKMQLGPAIGNRTVYLRKVGALEAIAALITPKVQSVGLSVPEPRMDSVTTALGAAGVQRFTPLGAMTHFDSPWDGFFAAQLLVRWASRPAGI